MVQSLLKLLVITSIYLGLISTEFPDYNVTSKIVSQSTGGALGLLISKDKAFGRMPFECYSKCYDTLVQSVINYGAAIWGSSNFSCLSAVQNRACRYFLGFGKYALTLQCRVTWDGYHMNTVSRYVSSDNFAE